MRMLCAMECDCASSSDASAIRMGCKAEALQTPPAGCWIWTMLSIIRMRHATEVLRRCHPATNLNRKTIKKKEKRKNNPEEKRLKACVTVCIRIRMLDGDRDGGWTDEDRDDFDSGDSGDELLRSDSCRFRQFIMPEDDRDGLPDAELRSGPGSDGDRFMGLTPERDRD